VVIILIIKGNYDCIDLEWDTRYFGIKSARVNLNGVIDENQQEEILKFCQDFEFVTIVNYNNLKENNYWIGKKTNAFLTDVNVQFEKELKVNKKKLENKGFQVKNNLPRNQQIIDIARKSFNYSRFFNDPNLSFDKAKNIYVHWTDSAFKKEDKFFVISRIDNKVAGYILFSTHKMTSTIELIAVEKKYQGKNIGRLLIRELEEYLIDKGILNIKVGTQLNNISAVNFYETMGFKVVSCRNIYHLWDM